MTGKDTQRRLNRMRERHLENWDMTQEDKE